MQASGVGEGQVLALEGVLRQWASVPLSRKLPSENREAGLWEEQLHLLSLFFMVAVSSFPHFYPVLPLTLPPLLHLSNLWL